MFGVCVGRATHISRLSFRIVLVFFLGLPLFPMCAPFFHERAESVLVESKRILCVLDGAESSTTKNLNLLKGFAAVLSEPHVNKGSLDTPDFPAHKCKDSK